MKSDKITRISKVRNYICLSHALLESHGNRKRPGRLSILLDLSEDLIYAVPREIEHIDFARMIAGCSLEENAGRYSLLVPSHIYCVKDKDGLEGVCGVITGVCGMEIEYGARHRRRDIGTAHFKALNFVTLGEVKFAKHFKDEICMKYVLD